MALIKVLMLVEMVMIRNPGRCVQSDDLLLLGPNAIGEKVVTESSKGTAGLVPVRLAELCVPC